MSEVVVEPKGVTFHHGMALTAEHFHAEWALRHRALADALGVLTDGASGLLVAPDQPDNFDPVTPRAQDAEHHVLRAGARVLLPWGVVLEVKKDCEFRATAKAPAYLRCAFDASSRDRYRTSVDADSATGDGETAVRIAPDPVVYHLRATADGRAATAQLTNALRAYAEALVNSGDTSVTQAARLSATVAALAVVEPVRAPAASLTGFERVLGLLDNLASEAPPRSDWSARRVADLARAVGARAVGILPFPSQVRIGKVSCGMCPNNTVPENGKAPFAVVGPVLTNPPTEVVVPLTPDRTAPQKSSRTKFKYDREASSLQRGFSVYVYETPLSKGTSIDPSWQGPFPAAVKLYAQTS